MRGILLALALFFSCLSASFAQDAVLRVQERAKYFSDFQALLEHEDRNVRRAAMEEALVGDDTQLRSMALETALACDDERQQTAALRWYIDSRSQILVTFLIPERPSDAQKFLHSKWNGLILKDPKMKQNGSEIEFTQYYAAGGQLIRGGMEFRLDGAYRQLGNCAMTVKSAGGTILAGQFACTFVGYEQVAGGAEAAVPVRIDLD